MTMLDKFLNQIGRRGLPIRYDGDDKLSIVGPQHEKTAEVISACKAFKPELLRKLKPQTDTEQDQPQGEIQAPATTAKPGPQQSTTLEVCSNCRSLVNPSILSDPMTPKSICGVGATKQNGGCPYQKQ